MKKLFVCFLSLIMIIGMIQLPAFASSAKFDIQGIKTEDKAAFTVSVTNSGDNEQGFKVYVACYDEKGIMKSAKTYLESAESGTTCFGYEADISNNGSAKIFVWESGLRPLRESFSSDACMISDTLIGDKLDIDENNLWASITYETENPAKNTVDGNLASKFTVKDVSDEHPQNITYCLGDDYILSSVGAAFGLGNDRDHIFAIESSEDGENFKTVLKKRCDERTNDMVYYNLPLVRARYVRINFFGRKDQGAWTQFSEIEIYAFKDNIGTYLLQNGENEAWNISSMDEMTYTDYTPMLGEKLYAEKTEGGLYIYDEVGRDGKTGKDEINISFLSASQEPEADSHPLANVTDEDLNTIWTAKNVTDNSPAYIVADLKNEFYLSGVGIAFDMAAARTYSFAVSVSDDNKNYKEVVSKRTSAASTGIQNFEFPQIKGRYIKYTFYKRTDASDNGWIRIGEIKAFGGTEPIEGAGGALVQKKLPLPENRGDFSLCFDLNIAKNSNTYYSGISITDGIITGGADLDNYAALQLRFANDSNKVSIKRITSNYFNEDDLKNLFENTFNMGEDIHFEIKVSPLKRMFIITVSDSVTSETQLIYFNYADKELTRNTSWTWLQADTLVFNTGAGAKCSMNVKNISVREIKRDEVSLAGADPVNGIIRLEAVRLSGYPTSSGDYYGRYVYHSGNENTLKVAADKNPAATRFAERRGLIGCGVSLESVTMPGHFIVMADDAFYLEKLQNNADFYSRATFIKEDAENVGYYTGAAYSYRTYRDVNNEAKYLYDTTSDKKQGELKPWKKWTEAQGVFYLRSEATEYVCDNFYGNSISSQWWKNYPWKSNNPTNDSYNFTALITKNNIIVENGELLLKATKIPSGSWPRDLSGKDGKQYNGDFGRTDYVKWQGYVGVVSIQNKVFNKQCYIEGSFKQPNSPIGYWNAFWLCGRDSWPPEIDIFETLSGRYGKYSWHTAIHGENDQNNLFGKQTSSIDITADYHTFALDWGYDYVKFYVDGKLFQRAQNNATLNYQKNLRLILNTGIGGWEYEPNDTMVWDDGLRCRYIRSFKY